ncbi:MAG TPA: peptidoglycan recognition family protein, partial [Bryobacteraceae bacterium]|nr:peptidoglycan recognition family protein [Bryobacteraceae bacterium]
MDRPKIVNGSVKAPEAAKLFLCPAKPEAREPSLLRRYSTNGMNWYAGQIQDPVARLKFLQRAAPRLRLTYRTPWRMVGLILALGVIASTATFFLIQRASPQPPVVIRVRPVEQHSGSVAQTPPDVWQVEKTASSEVYSNGLRIDTRFAVSNRSRSYLVFPLNGSASAAGVQRTQPVGIVFHTTESQLAPFEADQNRVLKRLGESLLEYVRRERAYHFLIDRFGRVYRIVAESDAANHSGNSIWADDQSLYINLNQSFFGVSIEARTEPGQVEAEMSPAQLRAAAMLTEMLRSKYHIAAANCVTHAQVSVNPSNMQIGLHVDWASSSPYEKLGLPDNYQQPLPALWASGFEYNPEFQHWGGARIEAGIQLAEDRLAARAAEAGMSVPSYRKLLKKRYR